MLSKEKITYNNVLFRMTTKLYYLAISDTDAFLKSDSLDCSLVCQRDIAMAVAKFCDRSHIVDGYEIFVYK